MFRLIFCNSLLEMNFILKSDGYKHSYKFFNLKFFITILNQPKINKSVLHEENVAIKHINQT